MEFQQRQQNLIDLRRKLSILCVSSFPIPHPLILDPTYLVGEITIAPTWCFFIGSSNRNSFSTTGIRNDSVFPLPVTASTTTSLCAINRGIADACTGVIRVKPMDETASRAHCDNGGFTPSHDLADAPEDGFGAIVFSSRFLFQPKSSVLRGLQRCCKIRRKKENAYRRSPD